MDEYSNENPAGVAAGNTTRNSAMKTLPPARQTGKRDAAPKLLHAALQYAERGWRVFPLHSPTPDGCTCASRECPNIGKHPRTSNGLKGASTDPTIIRRWWGRWLEANIAIVTGP